MEESIFQTYCNVLLLALKCHYLAYFAVIWIQIRIFVPDADFDQDGPRYTLLTIIYYYWALFALKWQYLGYFDVIRIRICEPDADFDQDMDPDIPNLL